MGPFIVEAVRKMTSMPIDVHLMVDRPDDMIPWYAAAGANRISVQEETCPHLYRTLDHIHSLGCKAGAVINPGTPVETLSEVLPITDLVLVMTVNPGFSGQAFIPAMLPKISRLNSLIQNTGSQALIQVDGGIDVHNLAACYQAGARVFVSATSIFKHPQGIAAGINALRSIVA
jgi:ribulose-phosphate 3-epimerase